MGENAYRKHDGRDLNNLDIEIAKIQKSTKTLFSFMTPIHERLRMHFGWYYRWHITPWAKPAHWMVLLVYIFTLGLGFYNGLNINTKQTKAVTTYDFPRWEWVTPKPTGETINKITSCSDGTLWAVSGTSTLRKIQNRDWEQIYTGSSQTLHDIICVSSNNVIAVGREGTIIRFDGLSWSTIESGSTSCLFSITKLLSNRYFIVGESGKILLSDNEGASWTLKNNGLVGLSYYYVQLSTGRIIVKGGHEPLYYKVAISDDDGDSWRTVIFDNYEDNFINAIAKSDTNDIIIGGSNGMIFTSSDQGESWSFRNSGITKNIAKIITSQERYLAIAENTIIISDNKGLNWTNQVFTDYLSDIIIFDTNTLALLTSDSVYVSTNNGESWSKYSASDKPFLSRFTQINNTLYAYGSNGRIVASTNGGATWIQINQELSAFAGSILKINATCSFIMGSTIYKTTNVGKDWEEIVNPTSTRMLSSGVFDENNFVAVGSGGKIITSSDGGATWIDRSTGFWELTKLVIIDSNNAVAVGLHFIRYTRDKGVTWDTANVDIDLDEAFISDIDVVDSMAQSLIAVGYNFKMLSTDNGANWVSNENDIYRESSSILVFDAQHITVSTGSGIILSEDAGNTFNYVLDSPIEITSFTKLSSTEGYALGGALYKTVNQGNSWEEISICGSNYFYNLNKQDNVLVVSHSRGICSSQDLGANWTNYQHGIEFHYSMIFSFNDYLVFSPIRQEFNNVMQYHSPANATATKYLIKLPGQDFVDGVGIIGTPTAQKAGVAFTATVYAVDENNILDRGNASFVNVGTSDPNDNSPGQFQLTQDGTCVQVNKQEGDPDCGIGTVSLIFHTAGTWNVSAQDPNMALTTGSSSSISINPGDPSQTVISFPSSIIAGSPTKGTITLKDPYGNTTTSASDTVVNLSSSSTRAFFSSSEYGAYDLSSITIPAGSSSVDFWYLDSLESKSTTITSTSSFGTKTNTFVINPGAISTTNSQFTCNQTEVDVSSTDNVSCQILLYDRYGNTVVGSSIKIFSNRAEDSITQPIGLTGEQGEITFSLHSTKSGASSLLALAQDFNIYLDPRPSIKFKALAPTTFKIYGIPQKVTAGDNIYATARWYDQFSNKANLSKNSRLKIITSDDRTQISLNQKSKDKPKNFSIKTALAESLNTVDYSTSDAGGKSFVLRLYSAGMRNISVFDEGTNLSVTNIPIEVTTASPSANDSQFTIYSNKIAVDSETTATVKIVDKYNNPIEGKSVTIYPLPKNLDLKTNPTQATTDSNGKAIFKVSGTSPLSTVLYAKNETDNQVLDQTQFLEVVPATVLQKALDILRNSELIQNLTQKILKPLSEVGASFALTTLVLQALTAIPQTFHFAAYGLTALLQVAHLRRRKKPWGVVFDSLSGKRISTAIVRLYETKTKKLMDTKVTDADGRFSFNAPAETYHCTVSKEGYQFPATFFPRDTVNPSTLPYSDRYLGQSFTLKEDRSNISLVIPIDPKNPNWTFFIKLKVTFRQFVSLLESTISYTTIPFLLVGGVLSLVSYAIKPDLKAFLVLLIYALILIFFLIRKFFKDNRQLFVYDSDTGKPIAKAVIMIFDQESKMLKSTLITNELGKALILLQKGNYEIKIDYQGYIFSQNPKIKSKFARVLTKSDINIRNTSFLHISIPMKKRDNSKVLTS